MNTTEVANVADDNNAGQTTTVRNLTALQCHLSPDGTCMAMRISDHGFPENVVVVKFAGVPHLFYGFRCLSEAFYLTRIGGSEESPREGARTLFGLDPAATTFRADATVVTLSDADTGASYAETVDEVEAKLRAKYFADSN
jgi:hypothetical protein